jgi:hypothetical protein
MILEEGVKAVHIGEDPLFRGASARTCGGHPAFSWILSPYNFDYD